MHFKKHFPALKYTGDETKMMQSVFAKAKIPLYPSLPERNSSHY